jgi:alpha-beta hydrolase superfamily lysophospholipase
MPPEEIRFPGATGAYLSGLLHHPAEARGGILLSHCFTCSKDLHTMSRLADGLADAGYAVLRFDFTGIGASGGEFSETTVSTRVTDINRAARALIERGSGPCGLIGHSLGGAATLLAAGDLHTVRSVAVIGAPAEPGHVRHLFTDQCEDIRRKGQAPVEIAGRTFPISVEFLDDLDTHKSLDHIAGLARPLLVMHAVDDEVVGVDEGEKIFAAARQPKAFVPLLGTDHLLTSRASAEEALAVLVDWFGRTL